MNIVKVLISIDNQSYKKKPSGGEIAAIKKRTACLWREIELDELADLNGNKGHAIVPAHLAGGMKTENCTAMQLLVLDFDGGCTFEEMKRKVR